jgi:hypothetical protein
VNRFAHLQPNAELSPNTSVLTVNGTFTQTQDPPLNRGHVDEEADQK